ncbi:MAG: hemerythrin domain-containing protein [Sulfuritalea sp.]|nr:hemerythrin domain-containing protein [Sulfuritalea sp.]
MAHTKANWSEAIVTGLPTIDSQHKALFDLAASFRGDGDQIRVMHTLTMLCDYANTHLRDEEALLEKIGYRKLAEHRLLHQEFRRMLSRLLDEARSLTLDQIADRIEELINGWFYHHILTVDAEYVAEVRAHQAMA